ncbi:prevent-host-death protein [Ligilactobacillus ruminis]|uniref:Prevent-host-death protein n=2 Tax=Ligilactobacillus ruminis TaxID=1623 RepID=A0A8B2Z3G2_9LACO|nr:prevent-host-death protein [Ligilactobacillus ruminis]
MIKIRAMMARIFSYSGRHAKISLKFTDKQGFLSCLSVSKTHFTDKPASSNDLSVNFWPL